MLQAQLLEGPPFDWLAFEQNGLAAAEVDFGWGKFLQALVIALRWAVIGEQPRPVHDFGFFDTRPIKRKPQYFGHVLGAHRRKKLPRDDVAQKVFEER